MKVSFLQRNRFQRILAFATLVLCTGGRAAAADFGLALSAAGEYVSGPNGEGAGFSGSATPWLSAAPGEKTGLYLSAKVTFEYPYDEKAWEMPPLVELERTELSFRPVPEVYLVLGRQQYRDSGGMIASGLFDGLYGSFGLGRIRLTGGLFYTGFLYKETAEILMTEEDRVRYVRALDYGDLDSYFASRRGLAVLGLEFPDLSPRLSLVIDVLGQFDLNGETALHTQYLEGRLGMEAAPPLRFTLTGIGALAEREGADLAAHFAAAFGAEWDVPGALTDMAEAELRWGNGAVSGTIVPFIPVSGIAQGMVFTPALPGLMTARAAYTARFHRTVSLSAAGVLFWRTDLETFRDGELNGASKERFLGGEIYGQLIWAPQSAMRFAAGGGVFLPGGAFVEDAGIRWKINGGIIVSL
jgi:hypothetical protein